MISLKNISFGYERNHSIYEDLTVEMPSGKIYGLFGKNGAGKSTLLRSLCGLLFPVSGEILINGKRPQNRNPDFLSDTFLIPEDVQMPNLSVAQYVKTYGAFYPKFSESDFYSYLLELEVADSQLIKRMSFGQQKKILIAFGLATHARTLLMDEPTNGLDIPSKSQFRKLIASTLTEEKTYVISTHQVRDLDNLIDHVLIMNNGTMKLNASLDEITERLSSKIISKGEVPADVLYKEETLGGFAVLTKNESADYSKINLEHLFAATVLNPEKMDELFSTSQPLYP